VSGLGWLQRLRLYAACGAVLLLLLAACSPETPEGTAIVDVTVIDAINGHSALITWSSAHSWLATIPG